MIRVGRDDDPLAGQLRPAVDRLGAGAICFGVGPTGRAVENEIGREINRLGLGSGRRQGQGFGAQNVDPLGRLGFGFGQVNGRVGGAVDTPRPGDIAPWPGGRPPGR